MPAATVHARQAQAHDAAHEHDERRLRAVSSESYAIAAMAQIGVDIAQHRSKSVSTIDRKMHSCPIGSTEPAVQFFGGAVTATLW
jgi:hypothetical protein